MTGQRARRQKMLCLVTGGVFGLAYLLLHHVGFPLDILAGWAAGAAFWRAVYLDGWQDGHKAEGGTGQ